MPEFADLWFREVVDGAYAQSYRIIKHLHHSRSPFQTIDLYETAQHGKLLTLDGLIMLTEAHERLYHEMLVHVPMLSHPAPEQVLVIGGGDGGTVREVLRHETVKHIDMVEIDGEVVRVCRELLPDLSGNLDDPRVTLTIADAIDYVKGLRELYDVVLVDSTDPIGPGEGLFTREFYGNVKIALKAGGIMALQSGSLFEFKGELARTFSKVSEVFPLVKIYWAPVPCYPAGTWSYIFASREGQEPGIRRWEAASAIENTCQYYNRDIHRQAFALPNFLQKHLR
ncbi:MAG: polyamine aminopropyltransferase [bacterium]